MLTPMFSGNKQTIIEAIIEKYLTNDLDNETSKENISFSFDLGLSSEGASFLTIFNDFGRLEYLGIDIFGEMGRISHSYTFTEHFIVYNVVEVNYSEPFFVNPMDIPIREVSSGRYIFSNGRVYRFIDEEENMAIDGELAGAMIKRLMEFLNIITLN